MLHDLDRDWPAVDSRIIRRVKPTFRLAVLSGASRRYASSAASSPPSSTCPQ